MLTLLLAVFAGGCPVTCAAASDDYLKALENEANDTGARTDAAQGDAHKAGGVQDRQLINPGLDFDAFETELKTRHAGTWFLYNRLSEPQRKAVFGVYQNDNTTSAVRDEIVRQLSPG